MHDVAVVTVFDGRKDLPEFVARRSLVHPSESGDIICEQVSEDMRSHLGFGKQIDSMITLRSVSGVREFHE